MKATKEQIIAEANRRRAEQGEGAPPVEHFIVDVVCEGWTPPEPVVDPDILAFREWLMEREPDMRLPSYEYDADFWDNCMSAQAYLAGARWAREQEREKTDHAVAFTVRVKSGLFKDLDEARREARKVTDRFMEGGR